MAACDKTGDEYAFWAKEDDSLVEVIGACLDGHIYFSGYEKTGKQTRDTLDIGYTFKGAEVRDSRGYPDHVRGFRLQ